MHSYMYQDNRFSHGVSFVSVFVVLKWHSFKNPLIFITTGTPVCNKGHVQFQ